MCHVIDSHMYTVPENESRDYIKEGTHASWLNCHKLLKSSCWFSLCLWMNLKWQTLIRSVWANQRSSNQNTPEQFSQSAPGLPSSACLPSLLLSYFLFLSFCLLVSLLIMPSGIQLHGSDKHGAPLCLSFSLSFSLTFSDGIVIWQAWQYEDEDSQHVKTNKQINKISLKYVQNLIITGN